MNTPTRVTFDHPRQPVHLPAWRRPHHVALAALAAVLLLAGCGDARAGAVPVYSVDVPLKDGRQVACVVASGGGITCDWDSAR